MERTILFLSLFLMLQCTSPEKVAFRNITVAEALALAQSEGKMVLIDFWTDG